VGHKLFFALVDDPIGAEWTRNLKEDVQPAVFEVGNVPSKPRPVPMVDQPDNTGLFEHAAVIIGIFPGTNSQQ